MFHPISSSASHQKAVPSASKKGAILPRQNVAHKGFVLFSFLICLFFLYFSVTHSAAAIAAGKRGLSVCAGVVIPSLFPFFVFSSLAVRCGLISSAGRAIAPVGRFLFRAPPGVTPVILMSMLSGSPVGASALVSLYESGEITKEETERFLPICSLASPAFILGSVAAMLGSAYYALVLYIVHVGSNFVLGFLFSRFFPKPEKILNSPKKGAIGREKLSASFVNAVKGSVTSILNVCGFVIIFCVIVSFLDISQIKDSVCALFSHLFIFPDGAGAARGLFDALFEIEQRVRRDQ